MEHAYVIGLDYGTDSVRALLVDALTGREIDSEVALYPRWNKGLYSDPRVARFRQHPKDYLEALRQSVRAVTAAMPIWRLRPGAVGRYDGQHPLPDRQGGSSPLAARGVRRKPRRDVRAVEGPYGAGRMRGDQRPLCPLRDQLRLPFGQLLLGRMFLVEGAAPAARDEALRRDAWSVVELCDWIPAVLTGCPDAASVKMGHCVCGSKLMWAEEWGGYPPKSSSPKPIPCCCPSAYLRTSTTACDVAAGTLTGEWASNWGFGGIPVGVGASIRSR